MKIIDINGSFAEKHLYFLEDLQSILWYNYKKAIDNKDQKAEASLAAALTKIQIEIDKAWETYNEEIGDGIDWEEVYKDEIKGDKK